MAGDNQDKKRRNWERERKKPQARSEEPIYLVPKDRTSTRAERLATLEALISEHGIHKGSVVEFPQGTGQFHEVEEVDVVQAFLRLKGFEFPVNPINVGPGKKPKL